MALGRTFDSVGRKNAGRARGGWPVGGGSASWALRLRRTPSAKSKVYCADGSMPSVPDKKDSVYQEDDPSEGGEKWTYSGPDLPEDIWCHIHSLVPLRDSAHSACVSRTFLRSWRCHPKLTFTKEALGLQGRKSDIAKSLAHTVDHILKNHSGSSVKTLELVICDYYNINTCHLNSWLRNAVTPGMEEITLLLDTKHMEEYSFPFSILVDDRGNSIRCLSLTRCALRPTVGFDCLNLREVNYTVLFPILLLWSN